MIRGVDTSKFQALYSYDPGSFEFVNGEEPDGNGGDFTATINRNIHDGRPWGVYSWVYPRFSTVTSVIERVRWLWGYDPPLGYWLDYEDDATPESLEREILTCFHLGIRPGVYTYLYRLPEVETIIRHYDLDLWLAYYPGWNDGTYHPEWSDDARQAGAVIHQYTSRGMYPIGLDVNVVLDEGWFWNMLNVQFPNPSPPEPQLPPPPPFIPEDDMPYVFTCHEEQDGKLYVAFGKDYYWLSPNEWDGGGDPNLVPTSLYGSNPSAWVLPPINIPRSIKQHMRELTAPSDGATAAQLAEFREYFKKLFPAKAARADQIV